jgi:hypothetical protein
MPDYKKAWLDSEQLIQDKEVVIKALRAKNAAIIEFLAKTAEETYEDEVVDLCDLLIEKLNGGKP